MATLEYQKYAKAHIKLNASFELLRNLHFLEITIENKLCSIDNFVPYENFDRQKTRIFVPTK